MQALIDERYFGTEKGKTNFSFFQKLNFQVFEDNNYYKLYLLSRKYYFEPNTFMAVWKISVAIQNIIKFCNR